MIREIGRQGKYLLLAFDDGAVLILHRGMSEDLIVQAATDARGRYTRLTLAFTNGRALNFADPGLFGWGASFPNASRPMTTSGSILATMRSGP
jgi:formamidopyrimidine-DNA glycosylase